MATERRQQRVEEKLRGVIGGILLEEEEWPEGVLVTITRVEVSEDLEHAAVFMSVFPQSFEDEVFVRLGQILGRLQYLVNRQMRMRPVPKLRFVPEQEVATADKIEEELYKLRNSESD